MTILSNFGKTPTRLDLPSASSPQFNARVRETLMTFLGRNGRPGDRGLTVDDLRNAGLIEYVPGTSGGGIRPAPFPIGPGGGAGGYEEPEPDLTPPPTPTGFALAAAFINVSVTHDDAIYTQGHGHGRTVLYGAKVANPDDPLPTFGDAQRLVDFQGSVYSYPTNPGTTWRMWIKWRTVDGVESTSPAGGINGLEVRTGEDIEGLLEAISGSITEGALNSILRSRINLIDGPASLGGSVAALMSNERQARVDGDNAEAYSRQQLAITVGGNTSAIQSEASVRQTETGGLLAQQAVKLDLGGHLAGYGLAATGSNGAATSQFLVAAGQFGVVGPTTASDTAPTANLYKGFAWLDTGETVSPAAAATALVAGRSYTIKALGNTDFTKAGAASNTVGLTFTATGAGTGTGTARQNTTRYYTGSSWSTAPQTLPFSVQTVPTVLNGQTVPPGLYADNVFFKNGSILKAMIGKLQVDDGHIDNLSASKITAGALRVGSYISSSNYVSGSDGFAFWAAGNAEFNNVTMRGTVYATAGSIGGIAIYGGVLQSNNWNWGSTGFHISSDGNIYINQGNIGGMFLRNQHICTGSFVNGWAWPTDGGGGFCLGPNGVLMGNYNIGKWLQIGSDGNVSAPGFSIINGNATFGGTLSAATGSFSGVLTASAVNAVDTINIAGNAVTTALTSTGAGDASVGFTVPPGQYWECINMATFAGGLYHHQQFGVSYNVNGSIGYYDGAIGTDDGWFTKGGMVLGVSGHSAGYHVITASCASNASNNHKPACILAVLLRKR